jgi:hypothetical protein
MFWRKMSERARWCRIWRAGSRACPRFSSYGDLATPSCDLNTSGNIWHEPCDNSWYAVTAIENPGDGKGGGGTNGKEPWRLTCSLISRASRLRTGARALDHLPGRRVLGLCGPGMAESDAGAALALVAQ